MKTWVNQKMNGAESSTENNKQKAPVWGGPALDAYKEGSMKKCDGQVESRLKHFFSIMFLAAIGLATVVRPAEATENTEEKRVQEIVMGLSHRAKAGQEFAAASKDRIFILSIPTGGNFCPKASCRVQ
ncbi:hypothetical protein [Hymenobacter metallicola]|uniref:Uncharacterized protein n=1 Tax=Hymenobacter metallicola TaxID=2563114 RepID=A0A4Z0QIF3_9BACT|nr:hypothetical protein [Hymenobacter metallicola]TGE29266.1 hypothetical protein E5K02_07370 [Hymenobacter metallicola]